jgi:sulfur-oxidizing protein SoxX
MSNGFSKPGRIAGLASVLALGVALGGFAPLVGAAEKQPDSVAAIGKKLAENRKKGNCLACHEMGDGAAPGNIAPPLVVMKQRFPDKATLRAQVYDARTKNVHTRMPPFGAHHILSGEEIDQIVEYLYTL